VTSRKKVSPLFPDNFEGLFRHSRAIGIVITVESDRGMVGA